MPTEPRPIYTSERQRRADEALEALESNAREKGTPGGSDKPRPAPTTATPPMSRAAAVPRSRRAKRDRLMPLTYGLLSIPMWVFGSFVAVAALAATDQGSDERLILFLAGGAIGVAAVVFLLMALIAGGVRLGAYHAALDAEESRSL